jgi:acetyl esterase/lipase
MDLNLVDPELALALEKFPPGDLWTDLNKSRQLIAQMRAQLMAQLPPVEAVEVADYQIPATSGYDLQHSSQRGPQSPSLRSVDLEGPEIQVRVYRPEGQATDLPAMLWIHGGGYCLGSLQQDDYLARNLCKSVGCVLVSVEYRLAPEHPFPAPVEDCYRALKWLSENNKQLRVNPAALSIGGISAGAGLAAGVALLARDRAEIKLIFQFLLCPMIDDRNVSDSSYMITDSRVWNRDSNLMGWKYYLGRDHNSDQQQYQDVSEYAAATRAECLADLPATYIAVGSVDAFVDENRDYAQRLSAAGVKTQLEIFLGGFHAFEFTVPDAEISKRARAEHYSAAKRGLFPLPD